MSDDWQMVGDQNGQLLPVIIAGFLFSRFVHFQPVSLGVVRSQRISAFKDLLDVDPRVMQNMEHKYFCQLMVLPFLAVVNKIINKTKIQDKN